MTARACVIPVIAVLYLNRNPLCIQWKLRFSEAIVISAIHFNKEMHYVSCIRRYGFFW